MFGLKFTALLALLVISLLLVAAPPALAQDGGSTPELPAEPPGSFAEFLTWLGTAGAFSLFMALILERVPNWAEWDSDLKSFISVAVAVGLALVSYMLVRWLPAGVVADLEPWYRVIFNAVVIWLGSQWAHNVINRRDSRTTDLARALFRADERGASG